MTQRNFLVGLAVIVLAAIIINTVIVIHQFNHIKSNSARIAALAHENRRLIDGQIHESCVISKRGLTSRPYLVKSLQDISELVFVAVGPTSRRLQAKAEDLADQAQKYVAISNRQPKTRVC